MSTLLPPFCEPLPYRSDSSDYFNRISHLHWPVFFDSTTEATQDNRYDIIAASPFKTLTTYGQQTTVETPKSTEIVSGDPFQILQQQLSQHPKQATTNLPFCGGAIGLFTYDLGRQIEDLPNIAANQEHAADMLVGLYDWAIVTDHKLKQCYLASFKLDVSTEQNWQQLISLLNAEHVPPKQTMTVSGDLNSQLETAQYNTASVSYTHLTLPTILLV